QPPPPPPKPQPVATTANPADTATIKAEAVVEYKGYAMRAFQTSAHTGRRFPVISHKWGTTALIPNQDITLAAIQEKGIMLPPVARRHAKKKKDRLKGVRRGAQEEKGLARGGGAGAMGWRKETPAVMENLAKTKSKDPNIVNILTAYHTMDAAM